MIKVRMLITTLALAFVGALGLVAAPIVVPDAAPTAQAALWDAQAARNTERPIWVYSGYGGGGHWDVLNAGEGTELAHIQSVWIPARCVLYLNYVKMRGVRSAGAYYNFYGPRPFGLLRLDCNR